MKILTEKEAEDFLEDNSFLVVKRKLIKNISNIDLRGFNYPLVAKISSRHIIHKAKMGGTILNLRDSNEVKEAMTKLCSIKSCEGVLIQEMIFGKEVIIGLKKTEEFGTVLLAGKGGGKVEEEKDISFRAVPLSKRDAEGMISELKLELNKKESEFFVKSILNLSNIAVKNTNITELDINPLIILDNKAVVVDARIVLE
jgi:succinyl-CoA synthetase beta subunit